MDPGYGVQDTRDYMVDPVLNKSNQRLVNSDLSSSTLGKMIDKKFKNYIHLELYQTSKYQPKY